MFIEASRIQQLNKFKFPGGRDVCTCVQSDVIYIHLSLHDATNHKDYTLLVCSNIPLTYIYDMYKLYTNQSIISTTIQTLTVKHKVLKMNSFFLENNMTIKLQVPQYVDVEKWLVKPFTCIVSYQLKTTNNQNESFEMFVQSPVRMGKYYAVGENDILLLSITNVNDSFEMHIDTLNMLLHRSVYCHLPFIRVCLDCCSL